MKKGKFNVVVDGQFGSTSKGKIATYLADLHRINYITTTNMANAGHVSVIGDKKFTGKALPSVSALNMVGNKIVILIGPSAGFTVEQLFKEMKETGLTKNDIMIHPRAGVIQDKHKTTEGSATKHIGSTMQGCGAMLSEKIMRGTDVKLARDFEELKEMVLPEWEFSIKLMDLMDGGATILHEGAQGFSLGINHGHSYPTCTSRDCTALAAMADLGIAPQYLGDVYLVIRADHAIRVGNIKEGDKTVGYSGDVYPDQHEISWDDIKVQSGCPADHNITELTTVTGRVRRVFTFSWEALAQAVRINGATKIAVNFANYIDWDIYGKKNNPLAPTLTNPLEMIPPKVKAFLKKVAQKTDIIPTLIGTGPEHTEMIDLEGLCFSL
jgi:adenylosuccinate synthase